MTLHKPYLFIKRLVIITHDGSLAYDEEFHRGVNIIRGVNSSGKSTIANFLFYALGGDYTNWVAEAKRCESVFIEIEVNEATLTLKRNIAETSRQPMAIFWGSYDDSIKANYSGWKIFPYQQTDNKESFTRIIFNALNYPEVKMENESNITMHQLLRLIYIDQDSPIQNLFKFERFDQPLTRQAVSELLLGVYNDSLYDDRLELKNAKKTYEEKEKQFDSIRTALGSTNSIPKDSNIYAVIEEKKTELIKIQERVSEVLKVDHIERKKTTPLKVEELHKELSFKKSQLTNQQSQIIEFEFEITDSKQFIESLERRVTALDNALLTRKVLGELPLNNCPQCLSPLEVHVKEDDCMLCKQPLSDSSEKTQAKRLKQEIELQIKESQKLLVEKINTLNLLKSELPSIVTSTRLLQNQLDLEEKENRSSRNTVIDELLVRKGTIEAEISYLLKQTKAVELLKTLQEELIALQSKIVKLERDIRIKFSEQEQNLAFAINKIQRITKEILALDLERQTEFKNPKSVEINFIKDTFSIDGYNNFSASSNTYLKNAVRFAIFFASLELPFFRYPRLIICDNMEDKGMEQIRTQNFQKVIIALSEVQKVEHQIIFTTSMIDPAINNKKYCIGKEHNQHNKSLKV
jgi:hypothetical protein